MDYKKKLIVGSLLIIALLNVPFVQIAQAGSDYGASTWAVYFKDVMVKAAAQTAFKFLSNRIISKIQTGGAGGKAAFVQNWINFQTNAQYQGESIFRSELSNSRLCGDFSNSIKAIFGVKPTSNGGSGGNVQHSNTPIGGVCRADLYPFSTGGTAPIVIDCIQGASCDRPTCNGPNNKNVKCTTDDICLETGGGTCRGICKADSGINTNVSGVMQFNNPTPGQNLRTGNLDSFALLSSCTMPSNFNMTNYQKDFAGNGGWAAFSRMLEPQNNYYGALFASLDEVTKQRQLSQSAAINNAVAGKGFTGLVGACKSIGLGNICNSFGDIKTPGSTLEGAAQDATSRGTTAMLAGANGASIAVSALTTWVLDKMFDLGGSPAGSEDVNINSEQRTAESYAQEFCTAADNISSEAKTYVQNNFPQAYQDFPPGDGSVLSSLPGHGNDRGSYCQSLYDTKNSYPYSRCSQACLKSTGQAPSLMAPVVPPPPVSGGGGVSAPTNSLQKHPSQAGIIGQVQSKLIDSGVDLSGNCGAFKVVSESAKSMGGGAGVLAKPDGENCNGFAKDIIAYPDGYIYDVLIGSGANGGRGQPTWRPAGCGSNGTCPDLYRSAP